VTLATASLAECFDLFGVSAFRVETLSAYDAPAEAGVLEAFREGRPLPERSVRTSPWLARIARTTAAGKSWSRTRVTGWPLTEYERFQLAYGYPPSEQAGEVIRVASRVEHLELAALGGDFWLFDGDTASPFAALMSYDESGCYLGSEVTDDPGVIARCRAQARLAARWAVPLSAYVTA
jgi:uncharacterized protein DUF6879